MPLLIARKFLISDRYGIAVTRLRESYPTLTYTDNKVRCYVNKIYNPDRKLISEPRKLAVVPIWLRKPDECFLSLESYLLPEGIPDGYTIELLAMNLVYTSYDGSESRQTETPIFPGEYLIDVEDYNLQQRIEEDVSALTSVGRSYEVVGLLFQAGYDQIAQDLTQGLMKAGRGTPGDSIGDFRKVIEAWRTAVRSESIESSHRAKALKSFLSSSYAMLSNFGEHAGTVGGFDEANFAREIAVATSDFMIDTLRDNVSAE